MLARFEFSAYNSSHSAVSRTILQQSEDVMGRYIIRRIISAIITLFIIITLSFIIIHNTPGGPFSSEKKLPPEILQNILKKYHLDEPLHKQYLRYLGDIILKGDFGPSYRYKDYTVNELLIKQFPVSVQLGVTSLSIAVILGVLVGITAALKQNRWPDYASMSIAVLGISIPLFVVGPILMYIFALKLKILPTSGWITSRYGILTVIMPAFTLMFPYFAYISRMSRSSIIEVLRSDYIRTARAKGLKESVVIGKHVLKGALLPVVTYLGPAFSGIITGSVVVESIFVVPGIGKLFVDAALNRDYTVIMGEVILYSLILITANLIVDLLYGLLDPRITYK